ncbi:MAG TPA: hypothetical protein VK174_05815 [Chitinophagales bacterium]|nr:hypothetical protein [Chitinophagales bacterium]
MNQELSKYKPTNRKGFVEFLQMLHRDFIANPDGWENNNLESFLESISRYAEDIQGYYDNTGQPLNADEPKWQIFADILKGGTMYE